MLPFLFLETEKKKIATISDYEIFLLQAYSYYFAVIMKANTNKHTLFCCVCIILKIYYFTYTITKICIYKIL